MKVALRDDDTCYFTAPADLERVYAGLWDRVPVCLATVPFAVGYERAGIPREHWHDGEAFAIERNRELTEALQRLIADRRVTIALHGYTHQDSPGGFEFQAGSGLAGKVKEGHSYLQRVLRTAISIFVPPHNALSREGLEAVSQDGLNLLGSFLSFHPKHRRWETATLGNWWRVRRYRERTGRTRRDPLVYPHVIRYRHHAEFGCHSLVPGTTLEQLTRGFEEARKAGGHFCLATHYWELDQPLIDVMRRFFDYAERHPDVELVAAESLFTV